MAYRINCECGFVVRGENPDEIVARATDHMIEVHPDIVAGITPEQILAMAEEI